MALEQLLSLSGSQAQFSPGSQSPFTTTIKPELKHKECFISSPLFKIHFEIRT